VVIRFIDDHKNRFGVEPVCRVLKDHGVKIAPSTYYAAKKRSVSARTISDAHWEETIEAVFNDRLKGRRVAGYRKMHVYMLRDGHQISRRTTARIMRKLGLKGAVRGGYKVVTTTPDKTATRPPDLVNRDFTAPAPNRLWLVDFTYVPTWEGTGFTAFVEDVYAHRIVGWRTYPRMPVELTLDALEMALWIRDRDGFNVTGLIHHSDAGSQYTAIRYAARLQEIGARASIGSVGDSYDNAMAESVIGLYKTECVALDGPFKTITQLELATCDWVDYYNNHRVHSSIGMTTPVEYEMDYHQTQHNQPAVH
jgi:putative transposase